MKLASIVLAAILAACPVFAQAKGDSKSAPPKTQTKGQQCQAKTKDGDQCKRMASAGSQFCWQHGGKKTSTKKDAPAKKA